MSISRNATYKKKIAKETAFLCSDIKKKYQTEQNLKESWNRSNNPEEDYIPAGCKIAKQYSLAQDIPEEKLKIISKAHDDLTDWYMSRYNQIPTSYTEKSKLEGELYVTPPASPVPSRSSSPTLPNNNNNSFVAIGGRKSRKSKRSNKKTRKSKSTKFRKNRK
jgi:hypothetical protein